MPRIISDALVLSSTLNAQGAADFDTTLNQDGLATFVAGIKFSSTTLSVYEEGTWTPALRFGAASVGITYTTQTGTYTRIGNRVFCTMSIVLTSKGTSVGSADLSGLPFTVGISAVSTVRWTSLATNFINMWLIPSTGGTTIAIRALAAASFNAGAAIANTDFANNSQLAASFSYEV